MDGGLRPFVDSPKARGDLAFLGLLRACAPMAWACGLNRSSADDVTHGLVGRSCPRPPAHMAPLGFPKQVDLFAAADICCSGGGACESNKRGVRSVISWAATRRQQAAALLPHCASQLRAGAETQSGRTWRCLLCWRCAGCGISPSRERLCRREKTREERGQPVQFSDWSTGAPARPPTGWVRIQLPDVILIN